MALPILAQELQLEVDAVAVQLTAVTNSIAALPATPVEADLPTIVQIVADVNTAASALQTTVSSILTMISTTRINQ